MNFSKMVNMIKDMDNQSWIWDDEFKIRDDYIWPFVRNETLSKIIAQILYGSNININVTNPARRVYKFLYGLSSMVNYLKSIIESKRETKIVILDSIKHRNIRKHSKWFNYLMDYYFSEEILSPRTTLIIEKPFVGISPRFLIFPRRYMILDYIKIIEELTKKVLKFKKKWDRKLYSFWEYLSKTLNGFGLKYYDFSNFKYIFLTNYIFSKLLEKFILRLKPLLIVSTLWIDFSKLKECDVKFAFHQQGVIDPLNPTLIYGSSFFKSYLPNYYIFLGEYWLNLVREFSDERVIKTVIGFPHVENLYKLKLQLNQETNQDNDKVILIIEQPIKEIEFWISLVQNLMKSLKKHYKVILKLHPSSHAKKKYYQEKLNGIDIISTEKNVYELLLRSNIVVGYTSTVLFEALTFPSINQIFVFQDEFTQNLFRSESFKFYNEVSEIVQQINYSDMENNKLSDIRMNELEKIWGVSSWRNRAREFFNCFQ